MHMVKANALHCVKDSCRLDQNRVWKHGFAIHKRLGFGPVGLRTRVHLMRGSVESYAAQLPRAGPHLFNATAGYPHTRIQGCVAMGVIELCYMRFPLLINDI